MAILDLLGRRWTLRVLWELRGDPVPTFRALQQRCDGVSSSVLTERLAELREAAIVERADDGYRLTRQGRTLLDTLAPLEAWARTWRT
jgi:DNA-binding HxlR family transcriptional regulator